MWARPKDSRCSGGRPVKHWAFLSNALPTSAQEDAAIEAIRQLELASGRWAEPLWWALAFLAPSLPHTPSTLRAPGERRAPASTRSTKEHQFLAKFHNFNSG